MPFLRMTSRQAGTVPERTLQLASLSLLTLLLTACGVLVDAPTGDAPLSAGQPDPAYLMGVEVLPTDSIESLETSTGGRVHAWQPGQYAVLGFDQAPSEEFEVEANEESFASSGRSLIWSGGRSLIWSGGRSLIWSGGRSLIWSGGQFAWMPENTQTWQHIGLDRAHQLAGNLGDGVTVAIIDTGVDLEHPFLAQALSPSESWWDHVDDDGLPDEEGEPGDEGFGHGTLVAGIVRQVAPAATILPIRVLDENGMGDIADLVAAIDWAVKQGADVINLSLGAERMSFTVEMALRAAAADGVFVVASTGNTGDDNVTYPASGAASGWGEAMLASVTAVDSNDEKADFSTYHRSRVELSAPGVNIFGPLPESEYGNLGAGSGTSMASPMVAGALALALGEELAVDYRELVELVKQYSTDIYSDGLNADYENELGDGRLDVGAFLEHVVQAEAAGGG